MEKHWSRTINKLNEQQAKIKELEELTNGEKKMKTTKTEITILNTEEQSTEYWIDHDNDIFVYQSEEEMYVLVATERNASFCEIGDWFTETDLEDLVPFHGTIHIEVI